jgi:hypothetical protein
LEDHFVGGANSSSKKGIGFMSLNPNEFKRKSTRLMWAWKEAPVSKKTLGLVDDETRERKIMSSVVEPVMASPFKDQTL